LDNIDLAAAQQKGIKIFNTPDVVIQPVAELTVTLILDLLRQVNRQAEAMRQGRWERSMGRQLQGKTVGIIGLGRIGRRAAEMLSLLEAKVIGYDLSPDAAWAKVKSVQLVSLEEVLAQADILTLHLSKAAHSFCLDAKRLSRLKKGALLVNTSRGEFVDEQALEAVLKNGHLGAAALDVFGQEPYRGPLAQLSNVILTPHIATFTEESRTAMEMQASQSIVDFFKTL
jgi:D-3-phosphoglycerate dehydrogenase